MQPNLIKQILVCILLVIVVGVSVFIIKDHFFPLNNEKADVFDNIVKDKYKNNEFQLINVSTEVLMQRYFNNFKGKMLNDTHEAYKLLSEDTKNIFGSYEQFEQFINTHVDKLSLSRCTSYSLQQNKDVKRYIILDQYGNQYIFSAIAVLNYNVDINYSSNF